jgi:predicted ABC-type ATPase
MPGSVSDDTSTRGSGSSFLSKSESEDSLFMSDELSNFIYERRIAPERCVKEGARGQPQFWIVAGENGVGKTTGMERIAAQLQGPAQKINADDLAEYVEGYHSLAVKDPALAQEEAGDYTSDWCDRLQEDAGKKGSHILVESSLPGNLEDDVEFAESRGYETRLYVIAEPREISWTAVVDRTDKALKSGHIGTNAIVSDSGHTQRYAAWPRAVFDAESGTKFDHIIIARRNGTVMYHNRREERAGVRQWVNEPQGLEVLLLERHRGLGRAEVDWLGESWERLAASPQLKADTFMRSIPLHQHKAEILKRANGSGNRFDPFTHRGAQAGSGASEWRQHLLADLELIKSNHSNLGPSPQFDQRCDRYAAALIDLAYREVPQHRRVRRLGEAIPSIACEDHRQTMVLGKVQPMAGPKRAWAAPELSDTPRSAEGISRAKRQRLDERSRIDGNCQAR